MKFFDKIFKKKKTNGFFIFGHRKACRNSVEREKTLVMLGFIILVLWSPVFIIGEKISIPLMSKSLDKEIQYVNKSIEIEKKYLLKQAQEIAESKKLDPYIEKADTVKLLALTTEEKNKRKVDNVTVINKDGVTLSRSSLSSMNGDYYYQIYPWGQVLGEGIPVSTVGEGRVMPLIFVSGFPIINDGLNSGSIVTSYFVNDEYANYFRNKYLPLDTQMVFYSKSEGIVGNTFGSEEKDLIKKYFNSNFDLSKKGSLNSLIKINNKYYFVKNLVLRGPENSQPGGALIFVPRAPLTLGIILAFIICALMFIFGLISIRSYCIEMHPLGFIFKITLFFSSIFIISLLVYLKEFDKQVVVIEKPAATIYNSVLKFEPEWGVVDMMAKQSVAIKVISGGEPINAAQANIEFDPTLLKVTDIITKKSFCDQSFFLEKVIDNKKGLVKIACSRPGGFFEGTGTIAEIVIQPIKVGDFSLRFAGDTQVLAHDGLGTNVLRQVTNSSYRVLSSLNPVASTISHPFLFSPSHPNSEKWYNSREVVVSWPKVAGKTKYIYSVDQIPDTSLRDGQSASENILHIKMSSDGIYYIHVAAEVEGIVSTTEHIKVKIDTTSPYRPEVKASNYNPKIGEVVRFQISSDDDMSGLQKTYYYKVNDGIKLPLGKELAIPFQTSGKYTVSVRAFDNAENFSDTNIIINVKK